MLIRRSLLMLIAAGGLACSGPADDTPSPGETAEAAPRDESPVRLDDYATVSLAADLSALGTDQRRMIGLLIEAADIMDRLFWYQAYGDDPVAWLEALDDEQTRRFAEINYGPWDRLNGDRPFVAGVGQKPPGARFYPADMSVDEFEAWEQPAKTGLYSLVRRDETGALTLVPYHVAFATELAEAAALLRQAAGLAADEAFAEYLTLRADALVTDDYQPSDLAWLDVEDNDIELVIGAIETYEDQLFGYRAAYEAYVLLKDRAWSESLARFAKFLPELQRGLPVADAYKQETPGTDSDLNAYDVIYYAGHSNAGSKTIAINLPNDEEVQLEKGTRRLQLKNAMRAKFDEILIPIVTVLIAPEQRGNVTFDAFFANTMFHEVAHGLGVKQTINGRGAVRTALRDVASSIEEGKADVLGLYMITRLHEAGELGDANLMDNYVTFLASVFRSVRFGASSAHGKANMVRFNFFRDRGAFTRDDETGQYRVNFEAMQAAMNELSERILTLQGDGDYEAARRMTDEQGVVGEQLAADLARLQQAGIPVDIVFEQGPAVLGLAPAAAASAGH
ncbi:MAG: Zn-dependent hydrolase [Pseudomonadota bacterium]